MFVHPMRRTAQGAAITVFGMLGLVACDDPEANTDLRPEGAPQVLSVLVSDDPSGFTEAATYCAPNDDKRPGFVAVLAGNGVEPIVCPEDISMSVPTFMGANPTDPYVRIQFDELLDGDAVETLVDGPPDAAGNPTGVLIGSIAMTQPVVLTCNGMTVDYDGYYQPGGNSVTWPVGPSIVVRPNDPTALATGSTCTVTLKSDVIVDKEGVAVTDLTPFTFGIAALEFQGSDPAPAETPDEAAVIANGAAVTLFFNGYVDDTTFTDADVDIELVADCNAAVGSGTDQPVVAVSGGDGSLAIGTALVGDPGEEGPGFDTGTYLVTFPAGAEVSDLGGGTATLPPPAEFTLCFTVE